MPNVFDSLIVRALDSDNYILALTQSPNYVTGNNLSDGFTFDGDHDDNRTFADGFGGRTDNFTLDIENVAVATPVPEPATLMMFGGGGGSDAAPETKSATIIKIDTTASKPSLFAVNAPACFFHSVLIRRAQYVYRLVVYSLREM